MCELSRQAAIGRLQTVADHAHDPTWLSGYLIALLCTQISDRFHLPIDWTADGDETVGTLLAQLQADRPAA